MGAEIAALLGFLGLGGVFATIGTAFAGWMAWRIVEKAGFPGWVGLGSILLTLTGIGSIVPAILLWVFAFMRWPRDEPGRVTAAFSPAAFSPAASPPAAAAPQAVLPPPPAALADRRIWQLSGAGILLAIDPAPGSYLVTGAPPAGANELSVPDPSVGRPHARLLTAGTRLGLEDLGSPGGTVVDGARLLPEHGPRDISQARSIRFGTVELGLSRS